MTLSIECEVFRISLAEALPPIPFPGFSTLKVQARLWTLHSQAQLLFATTCQTCVISFIFKDGCISG